MQELRVDSELQGGKYRIVKKLGQGGFGITYEGVQTGLERRVAIKEFFMKDYCNRNADTSQVTIGSEGSREMVDDYRRKFLKEAQLIARMEDVKGVVRIHDIFEENQTAYYVMEFIPGGSLKQLVEQRGRLPEDEAVGYVRQVGQALQQLHSQSILHLDVKPDNILLNRQGEAVLIDFGVSKHYDKGGSQTSSTPVGLSKGFAPSEQYQQDGVNRFSPATDVYSLGATLFYLLTATAPPDANLVFEDGLPARAEYISLPVWQAIEQAMQPRKKDRTQTVEAFMQVLGADGGATANEPRTIAEANVADADLHKTVIPADNSTRVATSSANPKEMWLWRIAAVVILAFSLILLYNAIEGYNNKGWKSVNYWEDESANLWHNQWLKSSPIPFTRLHYREETSHKIYFDYRGQKYRIDEYYELDGKLYRYGDYNKQYYSLRNYPPNSLDNMDRDTQISIGFAAFTLLLSIIALFFWKNFKIQRRITRVALGFIIFHLLWLMTTFQSLENVFHWINELF